MTASTFAISYGPVMLPLFRSMGLGPRSSGVEVGAEDVRVRMGYGFRARIPLSRIRSAAADDASVTGWGVHGLAGKWLVNGSSKGLVRLQIEPASRAFVLGVPVRLRQLRLSLEEPEAFLAALG